MSKAKHTPGPREMTLIAIRKRFEAGSWDHSDCVWLYTKAEQHAELMEALEAITRRFTYESGYYDNCGIGGSEPQFTWGQVRAAIRKAKGE